MNGRITRNEKNGCVIMRFDMDNCGMKEFAEFVKLYGEAIRQNQEQSVLSLAVGGKGTPIFTDKEWFIDFLTQNRPYIKASAICGLDKMRQGMIAAVISMAGRQIKMFDTEEEALSWLEKQV